MTVTGLGDLAQGYLLRSRTTGIKQEIDRLTAELTSGQVSDVRDQLNGNLSFLTDVERRSTILDSYGIATAEAAQFSGAMQLSLSRISETAQDLSGTLISAGSSATSSSSFDVASVARAALESVFSTLNSKIAGRSLFAGNATNTTPLVDVDTVLADLTAAISGANTPSDVLAQTLAWFDDPAGFATSAYQGSADPFPGFIVSPDETVALDLRATDPGLTRAMASTAAAALARDPAFALTSTEQAELFTLSGQDLLTNQDALVGLQARVGSAEARIDQSTARNAATLTSLNMAKNSLLEADPFETATKLEEAQFQLQSLYSVTVRMSQLSLVNYL